MDYKAEFKIKKKGEHPLNIKGNPEAVIRRATRLITKLNQQYTEFDEKTTMKYQEIDRRITKRALQNIFGKDELQKIMKEND